MRRNCMKLTRRPCEAQIPTATILAEAPIRVALPPRVPPVSYTHLDVYKRQFQGRDYYVRQFRDMKIILDIQLLAPVLVEFGAACGETLARAHARTGDAVAISAYLGKSSRFATALGDFARLYADQNERDHAQLVRAIATGAVERLSLIHI